MIWKLFWHKPMIYLKIGMRRKRFIRVTMVTLTKIIKQLVKSFNKSREKMWKYKDLIINYNRKKPELIHVKPLTIKSPIDANDTVTRLTKRLSPYNEEDFKVISHRAFLSAHIRELLTEWEKDPSTPIIHDEASSEVIDNLKFEYPIYKNGIITKLLIA